MKKHKPGAINAVNTTADNAWMGNLATMNEAKTAFVTANDAHNGHPRRITNALKI